MDTDKDEYIHTEGNSKAQLELMASANSYVVAQMVDHAVLVLNENVHLTTDRVSEALGL